MKKSVFKAMILVLVTGVLLLGLTTTVSANGSGDDCPCKCGSQTWHLDSRDVSPIPGTMLMYKTASSVTDGVVTVGSGACVVWCADQPAGADVTFPYGFWTIVVRTDSDWGWFGNGCNMDVGYVDENGAFTSFAIPYKPSCYFDCLDMIIEWQVQCGSKMVPQGKYLAVRICNGDSVAHSVITKSEVCGGSSVTSPCSDPGYPTPELPAAILLGAGLVGVGGLTYVASRKKKATS